MVHGLSCSLARGIFPGLESVSLALAGGFLTTAPPGKLHISSLKNKNKQNAAKVTKADEVPIQQMFV